MSTKAQELPEEILKIAGNNLCAAANKYKIKIPQNLNNYDSTTFSDNSLDLRDIDEAQYIIKNAASEKPSYYALESKEKYPLSTSMQVKKASAYFEKNYKKMPLEDLHLL